MKKFEFNDCNVCTNPNVIHIDAGGHWYAADIKTAEHDGKWFMGVDVILPLSGHGYSPAFGTGQKTFPTERVAQITAFRECITFVKSELNSYKRNPLTVQGDALKRPSPNTIRQFKAFLAMLYAKLDDIRQLTLFT